MQALVPQAGLAHSHPASTPHAALQPSPSMLFPSSHCSSAATIPSPHVEPTVDGSSTPAMMKPHSREQIEEHPSPSSAFPSSHSSPAITTPSLQTAPS